ncbi:MAG: hypothetical protein WKG06_11765 [Segetibacter sp.]
MKYKNKFTEHYADLLEGQYDCIDRIVLNAYYPKLLSGGGFRDWWRQMQGSDEGLSTAALMRMAGVVSQRVQAYCKKSNIPFVHYQTGERKHEDAAELLPVDAAYEGIFAIFCSRATSILWEVHEFGNGKIDIRRKKKPSLVNHYYFHIKDKQWGHICIRLCAHPPFSCNVILNGHEWVENHKGTASLEFTKESNCFTSYTDGEKLSRIADTLKHQGHLEKVCQRWVYGCLWFALDYEGQKKTGFSYRFSVYQVEYSRNFLFKRGRQLDDVYQHIINLTRERIDIPYLKTLLGRKNRPYITKRHSSGPEVQVQTPDYNLTVFKIHVGKLTLKLYDKGERTLRAEVVAHNTKELGCKRSLEYFETMVVKLNELMGSFINNITYAHAAIIDDGTMENLSKPVQTGKTRLAGITLTNKRNVALMESVLALMLYPQGFSCIDLKEMMRKKRFKDYSINNARYDMRKLKGKTFVQKIKGKQKYQATKSGIQNMSAVLCVWKQELKPFLTMVNKKSINEQSKELNTVETHFCNARKEIHSISNLYGIKIAS